MYKVGRRLAWIERTNLPKRSARPPFRFGMIAGRRLRSLGQ